MYRLTTLSRLAGIGALVALAACESKTDVLTPSLSGGNEMFQSYVAIGNSITSGYQSGGINDSTQRQSYARLLAGQMGTQYHYASLAGRGCAPPINNALTGTRIGTGSTSTTCDLRSLSSVTDVLNNVAVPGARVLDPTSVTAPASNALTTFILGGKTQVQRALDARPTFTTIWIGNNDVLEAGATGLLTPVAGISPGIVSTQAQFQSSYDLMISQLLAAQPSLKGVLVGVVKVAGIPILSTGDTLSKSLATRAFINAATGKTVTIDPNCTGSTSLVNTIQLVSAIRSGAHPAYISCVKDSPAPGLGDTFILDQAEQDQLNAVIDGYNNYISAKAAAIGFAYLDPNPLFASLRATNAIPRLPNYTGANAATTAYGSYFSLDGVHPSGIGQKALANAFISVINAKYGTTLAPLP